MNHTTRIVYRVAFGAGLALAASALVGVGLTGCERGAEKEATPQEGRETGNGAAKTAPGEATDKTQEAPAEDKVRAPTAEDLAAYTADIEGDGPLMATIATTLGDFHCELYADKAPMTVANFVGLSRGLKPWRDPKSRKVQETQPLYDGVLFHRVIPNFMVQTGDPLGQGVGGPGYQFDDEIVPELKHDKGGTLSMANAGKGTNGSQFFITAKATPWLDGKHTVFGQCKEVDLVNKITGVPRDSADRPRQEVKIKTITISRGG
ncbi:peptidylprolyl isomerase [Haliangium sp.]|uniref:peptidylprolyl isomerase n=1 Tax=Haliangium sp. TaxID=2663208 RepID=UPI003D0B37F5